MARRKIVIEQSETRVSTTPAEPNLAAEEEAQIGFVTTRLLQAWSFVQIAGACRERYGFGKTKTQNLIARVRDGLKAAHERNAYSRVEQIGRLRALLVELHMPRHHPTKEVPGFGPDGRPIMVPMRMPKPVLQIERIERLLAELEGNRQPERVDVHVTLTAAMGMVLGQMTDQRLEQLAENARERRRLALVASSKDGAA